MGIFGNIEKENVIGEKELALNTIRGSAKATFDEAEAMYKIVIKGSKGLDIESKEEAYAVNNAVATQLALICELYLKSLYIIENKRLSKSIDELWAELRNPNKIDPSRPKSASGHHLDILIDNLSLDSKTILKNRICLLDKIKKGNTTSISIYDILKRHGLIEDIGLIQPNQLDKEIEAHKNTFVNARYGGQIFSKPDIKFLEDLTTQIRVLARYKIEPVKGNKIDVTKYEKETFPKEISELYFQNPNSISEELILLIGDLEEKKELFKKVMHLKLHEKIILNLSSNKLFFLIKLFDFDEIFNILEAEYPSLVVSGFLQNMNPIEASAHIRAQDQKNKGFTEFCINLKVMLGTKFPKEKINEILNIYLSTSEKQNKFEIIRH